MTSIAVGSIIGKPKPCATLLNCPSSLGFAIYWGLMGFTRALRVVGIY